ncbi:MAG: hypothetical protein ABSC29_02860 [Minisyncoccia bacterium]|jgi:hypothetical protein
MPKNSKYIFGLVILSGTLWLGSYAFHRPSINKSNAPVVRPIDFSYIADFADDKILLGASHNVFMGKVIRQIGTQDVGAGPETQFAVQIISNIKGDLSGIVTVNQEGGYLNGFLYMAESPRGATGYLLSPGSTYLLATRYSAPHNWYTLNPFHTASEIISENSVLNAPQLEILARRDTRVQELEAAYPKEILLTADLVHGNTRNSYQSLHPTLINSFPATTTVSSTPNASSSSN